MTCPNCGYCPHCGRSNTTQSPRQFQGTFQPNPFVSGFTLGQQYQGFGGMIGGTAGGLGGVAKPVEPKDSQ